MPKKTNPNKTLSDTTEKTTEELPRADPEGDAEPEVVSIRKEAMEDLELRREGIDPKTDHRVLEVADELPPRGAKDKAVCFGCAGPFDGILHTCAKKAVCPRHGSPGEFYYDPLQPCSCGEKDGEAK